MFANIAVVLSSLAIFAAATHGGPSGVSQCNTGPVQCCDQVSKADSVEAKARGDLLGIDVSNLVGNIGFQCSPISLVNVASGTNCAQAPVCCQGNKFNGLVNVGCTAIAL